MSEWLPIESAPKDASLFLAATSDGRMMIWRADLLARAMDMSTPDHLTFPATHWMPLPSPPDPARQDGGAATSEAKDEAP